MSTAETPRSSKTSKKTLRVSAKEYAKLNLTAGERCDLALLQQHGINANLLASSPAVLEADREIMDRAMNLAMDAVRYQGTALEDPGQDFWDRVEPKLLEQMYATEMTFRGNIVCGGCGDVQNESQKFSKCGGCEAEFYCSRECQRKDWSNSHRRSCGIMKRVKAARRKKWYEAAKNELLLKRHAAPMAVQLLGVSLSKVMDSALICMEQMMKAIREGGELSTAHIESVKKVLLWEEQNDYRTSLMANTKSETALTLLQESASISNISKLVYITDAMNGLLFSKTLKLPTLPIHDRHKV